MNFGCRINFVFLKFLIDFSILLNEYFGIDIYFWEKRTDLIFENEAIESKLRLFGFGLTSKTNARLVSLILSSESICFFSKHYKNP